MGKNQLEINEIIFFIKKYVKLLYKHLMYSIHRIFPLMSHRMDGGSEAVLVRGVFRIKVRRSQGGVWRRWWVWLCMPGWQLQRLG